MTAELNMTDAAVWNTASFQKEEVVPAASDAKAIQGSMIADDNVTALSEEVVTPALHFTFEQTAGGAGSGLFP